MQIMLVCEPAVSGRGGGGIAPATAAQAKEHPFSCENALLDGVNLAVGPKSGSGSYGSRGHTSRHWGEGSSGFRRAYSDDVGDQRRESNHLRTAIGSASLFLNTARFCRSHPRL